MSNLKTEKRFADVGEKIVIVNDAYSYTGDLYRNGDIFTVQYNFGDPYNNKKLNQDLGEVYTQELGEDIFILGNEYRVIVGELETPEQRIKALEEALTLTQGTLVTVQRTLKVINSHKEPATWSFTSQIASRRINETLEKIKTLVNYHENK